MKNFKLYKLTDEEAREAMEAAWEKYGELEQAAAYEPDESKRRELRRRAGVIRAAAEHIEGAL